MSAVSEPIVPSSSSDFLVSSAAALCEDDLKNMDVDADVIDFDNEPVVGTLTFDESSDTCADSITDSWNDLHTDHALLSPSPSSDSLSAVPQIVTLTPSSIAYPQQYGMDLENLLAAQHLLNAFLYATSPSSSPTPSRCSSPTDSTTSKSEVADIPSPVSSEPPAASSSSSSSVASTSDLRAISMESCLSAGYYKAKGKRRRVAAIGGSFFESPIICGLPAAHETDVMKDPALIEIESTSAYVPFFGRQVHVYAALKDASRKILISASDVAKQLHCNNNMLAMYLKRHKREKNSGIYQATSILRKTLSDRSVKVGGYFLSEAACARFRQHFLHRREEA